MKLLLLTLAVLVLLSQVIPGKLDLVRGGGRGGEWVSVGAVHSLGGRAGRWQ